MSLQVESKMLTKQEFENKKELPRIATPPFRLTPDTSCQAPHDKAQVVTKRKDGTKSRASEERLNRHFHIHSLTCQFILQVFLFSV